MNQITTTVRGLPASESVRSDKSARPPVGGRQVAIAVTVVFLGSLLAGLVLPQALQVPGRDTSLSGLVDILRSNLTLVAVLAAISGLTHFSRIEVEEGRPPWIRRISDLVLAVFLTLNVTVVGFAIGQLGGSALIRILPHAWLEVPAFALGVWGYLLARKDQLTVRKAASIYLTAVAMLLVAAVIETYVSGSI